MAPSIAQNFSIPASICDLNGLTFLYLSDNNSPCEFPIVLYNCSKLQELNKMPSNLTQISLSPATNLFNGTTPVEMGNLLTLALNPFPPAKILPDLTSLTYLLMSKKNLLGEIPNSFGKLVNLEHLYLAMNSLVGEIPANVWMVQPLS